MEAIGVSIDGNELKIAHLQKTKKSITILELEKVFLRRMDREKVSQTGEGKSSEDAFGLADAKKDAPPEEISSATGADENIIFNTISKYSKNNLKVGLNILQSDVSFTQISGISDAKEKNLRKKIKEKLDKISSDITDENFGFVKKSETDCIAFYHNNKLNLLNQILNAKSILKSGIKIMLVDSNEISLMNLYTNMIEGNGERNVLVYIGNEFSRILFFQGKKLINFSQLINEGYRSEGLLASLYGKIIFEIDTAEFEEIHSIFIAGDGPLHRYEDYFKEKFHNCTISRLPYDKYFTISNENKKEDLDSYAIPISIAWKLLAGKEQEFINTNFLSLSIRRQQKAFALSWHGFVIVIFMIAAIIYFFLGNRSVTSEIKKIKSEINTLNLTIEEVSPIAQKADSISIEIANIKPKTMLIDSIKPTTMLYSDFLKYITDNVKNINSLWIKDFSISGKNFTMSGTALYKSRIYKLASVLEQSKINDVSIAQIMGKDIFNFNISGEIPDKK